LRSTILLASLVLLSCQVAVAQQPGPGKFLTSTTENIGRPYQVLDGACVYEQFPGMSLKDPLETALASAFKKMETMARAGGADALIRFDVDFASRPQKGEEGRVLLCGTLVKFTGPPTAG
jgi:hypothetical protein